MFHTVPTLRLVLFGWRRQSIDNLTRLVRLSLGFCRFALDVIQDLQEASSSLDLESHFEKRCLESPSPS
jgi:hypothetical protein